MKERSSLPYRLRGILMAPPVLFTVVVFFRETECDAIVWPFGGGVFLTGVFMRIWAQMHLHYRLRLRKKLTTTGPYALVRNPIYVANTAMLLGMTIMSELLWFLPVMLVWCVVVYNAVVRCEERHLVQKYGDPYARYLEIVPRWFPRFDRCRTGNTDTKGLFWPSVAAELHCLLWIVPLIGKEAFSVLN